MEAGGGGSVQGEEEVNLEYLRNVILQFLEHEKMRVSLILCVGDSADVFAAEFGSRFVCHSEVYTTRDEKAYCKGLIITRML